MQDPPEGSQPHRHDEVRPDGVWYDNLDQADCSESTVIAALPALPSLARTAGDMLVFVSYRSHSARWWDAECSWSEDTPDAG